MSWFPISVQTLQIAVPIRNVCLHLQKKSCHDQIRPNRSWFESWVCLNGSPNILRFMPCLSDMVEQRTPRLTNPKLPLVDLQHPERILAWDVKLPNSHNKPMQPIQWPMQWISWSRIEGQNPSSHSSWTHSVHSTHYKSHSLCFNRFVSHPKSGCNHAWFFHSSRSFSLNPNSRYMLLMRGTLHQLMVFVLGRGSKCGCHPFRWAGVTIMTFLSSATKSFESLPPLHTWVMQFVQPEPHLFKQKLYIASLDNNTLKAFAEQIKERWKHHESIIFSDDEDPYSLQSFLSRHVCAVLITIGFRSNRNERHEGSINPSEMLQIKRPTGKFGGCRNQTQKKLSQNSQKNLWIISSIWKELVENSKAYENSNPRYSSNTWPSIWLMDFKTMAFCCCPSLSGGFGGNSPNLMGITFLGVDEVYDASMEWTCTSRDCTSYDGEIKNTKDALYDKSFSAYNHLPGIEQ